jgi:hypothetical protein
MQQTAPATGHTHRFYSLTFPGKAYTASQSRFHFAFSVISLLKLFLLYALHNAQQAPAWRFEKVSSLLPHFFFQPGCALLFSSTG